MPLTNSGDPAGGGAVNRESGVLRTELNLIHAHFFFVDVVGLSDPTMTSKSQIKKIDFLNTAVAQSSAFKSMPRDTILTLPTGDGMVIGFLQGPELPIRLAIDLHRKIEEYNKSKIPADSIEVRIGIHSGPVYIVNDVNGNRNIWGPGIIVCRRVMDIGDDGHILLSARVAEDLMQLSDYYRQILHPLDFIVLKHGLRMMLYSAYGKNFGSKKLPNKMKRKINEFLYSSIEVNLTILDAKKMFVHYKRMHEIQSITDAPIVTVTHQIATDVPKTFEDLNIKVYDQDDKDLDISAIETDKPHQKEFATSFHKPILKGDRRRFYLEYDVEEPERYVENIFLTNCEKFAVNLDYPISKSIEPIIYEVDVENDKKKKSKVQPAIQKNGITRLSARWSKRNLLRGQSILLQW